MFWAEHLGCWGQNTSRIQNKEVYATLCLQAAPTTFTGEWQTLMGTAYANAVLNAVTMAVATCKFVVLLRHNTKVRQMLKIFKGIFAALDDASVMFLALMWIFLAYAAASKT